VGVLLLVLLKEEPTAQALRAELAAMIKRAAEPGLGTRFHAGPAAMPTLG
jgi:hypothetical protein